MRLTSSDIANRRLFAVGRQTYATNPTSKKYTRFSQPSRINHRLFQWLGTKSSSLWPANIQLLTKKNMKMTTMLIKMQYHSFWYMPALIVCLRSLRSLVVRLSELSVHT